jgi:hypothetical protein
MSVRENWCGGRQQQGDERSRLGKREQGEKEVTRDELSGSQMPFKGRERGRGQRSPEGRNSRPN